jgi:predicted ABC-type ATPase
MALSDDLTKLIYETEIKPKLFNNIKTVDSPTSVFLAGQPGSGKGNLSDVTISQFNGNAVVIDPDHLRQYHPDIKDVKDQYTLDVDSRKWKEMLISDCIKEKKNIIFDGTLGGNIKYIESDIRNVKDNGHNIQINALAVNDSVSKLGFTSRYEKQVLESGNGRPVDLSYHNEIYKNIPNNLTTIIGKDLVDEIKIYKRNHSTDKQSLLKHYSKQDLKFKKDSPIYEFDKERVRPFSNAEIEHLNTWHEKTKNMAEKNGNLDNLKGLIVSNDDHVSNYVKSQISDFTGDRTLLLNKHLKEAISNNTPRTAVSYIMKGAQLSSVQPEDFKGLQKKDELIMKTQLITATDKYYGLEKNKGLTKGNTLSM